MNHLFPPIEPFNEFKLQVSDLHEIHLQQSGNPAGKPAVFLHGGPGGGIEPIYRQYFDPEKWRLILFDQRGCGKSKPFAELRENTTWDLVADIEKIREQLGINRWTVFGGSWGSTLALAYSQSHPERCTALILRGIFLLRKSELNWFYQDGASHIFPDAWDKYLELIPETERGDLLAAYYKRLTDDDPEVRLAAARAWSIWEGSTSKLHPNKLLLDRFGKSQFAEAFARIECHYFTNGGFLESEDQLLDNIDRIRHIPAVIVQGRYDVVCPMTTAWDLQGVWPEVDFQVIPDAGHSMSEPGILAKLIEYTNKYSDL
ncbi:MAG: prolyl aminopeptidase [Candidatus Marinimicrobia bacterium]|nr:prolyl aminopeptidase [Candidatus Neomarinimicrobiota bacterium]